MPSIVRLALAAALAGIFLGAAVAPASGRTLVARGAIDAGPVIAGSDAVFARIDAHRRRITVRAVPLVGGSERTIGAAPFFHRTLVPEDVAVDASASHAAVRQYRTDFAPAPEMGGAALEALDAGPHGGPLARAGGCADVFEPESPPVRFDLDGSRLATWQGGCGDPVAAGPVVVRDMDSGTETSIAAGRVFELRLAGRYVAWTEIVTGPLTLVVHDLVAGTEAYRVANPGGGGGLALQPDGKVALGAENGCIWFSPAEPFGHPLPNCERPLAMDGDRVLSAGTRQLAVSDVAGNATALIRGAGGLIGADLVGGSAAVALDGCTRRGDELLVLPSDAAATSTEPRNCFVALTARRLRVRRRAVRLPIRCPDGCEGSVRLTGRGALRRASHVSDFEFPEGRRRRHVIVDLGRAALRTLQTKGRLTLRARFVVDRRGEGRSIVHRPVTLVR